LTPTPKPTPKQARRRDGIPTPHCCLQRRQHPVYDCRGAWRAPCVPILTVTKGQPRSLLSPVAEYPQVRLAQLRTMIAARSSKLGLICDHPQQVA
jgi:hypothetical protein